MIFSSCQSDVLIILLIWLVCQGAYGTAVLYKKKDDDSLVILKEINLHELNVSERQLAQNEVTNCQLIARSDTKLYVVMVLSCSMNK